MKLIRSFFELDRHGTSIATEVTAGTTTFLTMSYIIFVQPAVLSMAGMDFGSVMVATCLSSAAASLLMAVMANYPIAQAPAMGHNFFFAMTACGPIAAGGLGLSWQEALAGVTVSGLLLVILCVSGLV